MIKNSIKHMDATLENVYSELLQLAVSIGECKSFIEHTNDTLLRMHAEQCDHLKLIEARLSSIEKVEAISKGRKDLFWRIIEISPFNILKWLSVIGLIFAAIQPGILDKLYKLIQLIG